MPLLEERGLTSTTHLDNDLKAYHVKQWLSLYETSETRKIRSLTYYAKPNKLVGEGIGHTKAQKDGLALIGTFSLLVDLASTAPQEWRGWLVRNGTPLTAPRIANLLQIDVAPIERALTFFSTSPMDWLEFIEWEDTPLLTAHRESSGTPPGESPGVPPRSLSHRESSGTISLRGKTDRRGKTEEVPEREKKRGFASAEEGRRAQATQFAALRSQISELEKTPEEDRTEEEVADLKKKRGLLRKLQGRQAAGDFTPVQEQEVDA